jgi:hypothetical protein
MKSTSALLLIAGHVLHAQTPTLDSLELQKLHLQVISAEERVTATDFLHRLLPRITFNASFGVRDLLFVVPGDDAAYITPRDAYRLTLSLSLTDLLTSNGHDAALIERAQRTVDIKCATIRQENDRRARRERLNALRQELALLEEELDVLRKIQRYQTILFEEGKANYDALARSELQVIDTRMRIARLQLQVREFSVEEDQRQQPPTSPWVP